MIQLGKVNLNPKTVVIGWNDRWWCWRKWASAEIWMLPTGNLIVVMVKSELSKLAWGHNATVSPPVIVYLKQRTVRSTLQTRSRVSTITVIKKSRKTFKWDCYKKGANRSVWKRWTRCWILSYFVEKRALSTGDTRGYMSDLLGDAHGHIEEGYITQTHQNILGCTSI